MLGVMRKLIERREGAVAVEYALLIAVVGGGIAIGSVNLGNAIATALKVVGDLISA